MRAEDFGFGTEGGTAEGEGVVGEGSAVLAVEAAIVVFTPRKCSVSYIYVGLMDLSVLLKLAMLNLAYVRTQKTTPATHQIKLLQLSIYGAIPPFPSTTPALV